MHKHSRLPSKTLWITESIQWISTLASIAHMSIWLASLLMIMKILKTWRQGPTIGIFSSRTRRGWRNIRCWWALTGRGSTVSNAIGSARIFKWVECTLNAQEMVGVEGKYVTNVRGSRYKSSRVSLIWRCQEWTWRNPLRSCLLTSSITNRVSNQ